LRPFNLLFVPNFMKFKKSLHAVKQRYKSFGIKTELTDFCFDHKIYFKLI
jgi:hypothetical protein